MVFDSGHVGELISAENSPPSETFKAVVLVVVRLSSLLVFAPVFSSTAIPVRIKAAFTIFSALLIAPSVALSPRYGIALDAKSVIGEISVGLIFGLTLAFLSEALTFAGMLMGMQFSFSLVNLLDPNTMVDAPVLGQMLNWLATLTLLSAGLHRTVLSAFIHTFQTVPPGAAFLVARTGTVLVHMLADVLFAGVQLAAPVMAAALTVEVTIALVGRLSPQLPAMVLSIPIKTCVSYVVLIASLALWPSWIEQYFDHLLRSAQVLVTAG